MECRNYRQVSQAGANIANTKDVIKDRIADAHRADEEEESKRKTELRRRELDAADDMTPEARAMAAANTEYGKYEAIFSEDGWE